MRTPILEAIAKRAVTDGFDVVRFNFRGVGESTGIHGNGEDELQDVDAAMAFASGLDMPVAGIAGWSFGAAVCLNWQAGTASTVPYVGIAPPVRSPLTPPLPDPSRLAPARRAFIIGEKDQFIPAHELAAYAESVSAQIIRYRGADHFFVLKHARLADDVVDLIAGWNSSPEKPRGTRTSSLTPLVHGNRCTRIYQRTIRTQRLCSGHVLPGSR